MQYFLRIIISTIVLFTFSFDMCAGEVSGSEARNVRLTYNAAFNKLQHLQNQGKVGTSEYQSAYQAFKIAKQRLDQLTGPGTKTNRYGNSDGVAGKDGDDVSDDDITSDILKNQPVKSSVSVTLTIAAEGYVTKKFPVVFASDGTESGFFLEGHVKRDFNSVRIGNARITETNPHVIQLIQPDDNGNFTAVVDTSSGKGPGRVKKEHFRLKREMLTILVEAEGYKITEKKIMLNNDLAPETIDIEGVISHNSGNLVQNAKVTVKYRHFKEDAITDEWGHYYIDFDVADKGDYIQHPNTNIVLDRPVGVEIQAWKPGFEAQSSGPIVYTETGQPGLVIVEGVIMDDGIPPAPIKGAKISVLQGVLKSDNPETGADGRYKVFIQPNFFDPNRPAVKKSKNFMLKPSPLIVKLTYKAMAPDYMRFGFYDSLKKCPGTSAPGFNRQAFIVAAGGKKAKQRKVLFNVQASIGGKQIKDVVLDVRHDGYWRKGMPSEILSPPTRISSSCRIDKWGECLLEFDQPHMKTPQSLDFNPFEHFPVSGRLVFEYTDPVSGAKLEGKTEYTIVTPLPMVKVGLRDLNGTKTVDPEKYVFSGDEHGVISITLSDWDSRSFDIEIYGNGDFSYVNEEQRKDYWEDLDHGVRCNIELEDSSFIGQAYTWKKKYDINFTPSIHTMPLAEYMEKSGLPSDQLIKNLAYLGAETVGHKKIIQAIAQSQKANSTLSTVPGSTSVVLSGGFLVIATKKLLKNGEVIERITKFKLGDRNEAVETAFKLGDIWVPACDLALFGIGVMTGGSVTVAQHAGWQSAKVLYELIKDIEMSRKAYNELLSRYESIIYEPILIVVRDREGNTIERTIQLPVIVKMPKKDR